jgi:XTP/dITP diphosphohydrolase
MTGPLFGDTLLIASHNDGKVSEIRDLLKPFELAIRSAAELGLPEPEETGASFTENAELGPLGRPKQRFPVSHAADRK